MAAMSDSSERADKGRGKPGNASWLVHTSFMPPLGRYGKAVRSLQDHSKSFRGQCAGVDMNVLSLWPRSGENLLARSVPGDHSNVCCGVRCQTPGFQAQNSPKPTLARRTGENSNPRGTEGAHATQVPLPRAKYWLIMVLRGVGPEC